MERFHCEIHNEILEKYTNLVCKNLSTVDAGHRSFMIDETTSISLRENISIISDGTTGLCTWQVIKFHASGFMIIASPRNFLLFFLFIRLHSIWPNGALPTDRELRE